MWWPRVGVRTSDTPIREGTSQNVMSCWHHIIFERSFGTWKPFPPFSAELAGNWKLFPSVQRRKLKTVSAVLCQPRRKLKTVSVCTTTETENHFCQETSTCFLFILRGQKGRERNQELRAIKRLARRVWLPPYKHPQPPQKIHPQARRVIAHPFEASALSTRPHVGR